MSNTRDFEAHGHQQPMNLEEFLHRYASGADAARVVYDGEITRTASGETPFIIIRFGDKVMVINPMNFETHISLDVHAFVDGNSAGMGMFGMTPGRRHQLETDRPAKSHGWDAVDLATIILGAQTVKVSVAKCIHCDHEIRLDPDNGAGQPVWVHTFRYESTVCHDDPPGSVSDGTVATPPAS